jgi:hypothetical protein
LIDVTLNKEFDMIFGDILQKTAISSQNKKLKIDEYNSL